MEEKNFWNKLGDTLQFFGTISLFVYWSFIPLFVLGILGVVIPNLIPVFWFAFIWVFVSVFGIGAGAFLQEYKKKGGE